jgi:hypothetical protein
LCGNRIDGAVQKEWTFRVCESVTLNYAVHIREMLITLKRTVDSLNRLKKAKKKDSFSSPATHLLTDEEKITMQLCLDVEHFATQLRSLNIERDTFKPYQDLRELLPSLEKS